MHLLVSPPDGNVVGTGAGRLRDQELNPWLQLNRNIPSGNVVGFLFLGNLRSHFILCVLVKEPSLMLSRVCMCPSFGAEVSLWQASAPGVGAVDPPPGISCPVTADTKQDPYLGFLSGLCSFPLKAPSD